MSDKLDVDITIDSVAKELGITTDQMPKNVMDAIAFICTSDKPKI